MPELMDQILRLLEPADMFCLWLTGSSWVRLRLGKQGGWKRLVLRGDDYWPYLDVWPRWLFPELFGLSELRFYPRNTDCLMPSLRPSSNDLLQLPRSITRLEIGLVDSISDSDLPPIHHLPHSAV